MEPSPIVLFISLPQMIEAMKSKCIRHYLAMAVGIIIAAGTLVGCDWSCDYKIIFDNKTADTIVLAYLDSATKSGIWDMIC